jgi:hypothetical protein
MQRPTIHELRLVNPTFFSKDTMRYFGRQKMTIHGSDCYDGFEWILNVKFLDHPEHDDAVYGIHPETLKIVSTNFFKWGEGHEI